MKIKLWINEKLYEDDVKVDMPLLEYLRSKGCYSVKRGCETSNCGLCTVWLEKKPILSCTYPLIRCNNKHITTLEGLQDKAKEFGEFLSDEGADQCGFCNTGFIMNVLAMVEELENPQEEEIRAYLQGNLCRCTGYMGQIRAIKKFLEYKKGSLKI